jgi:cytochrome c oxidase subunit 4
MSSRMTQIFACWLLLVVLLAVELGSSFLPLPHPERPILLAGAGATVAVVAFGYMRLAASPSVARVFAAAGLLWLFILLGLGSVDPLTRAMAWVSP